MLLIAKIPIEKQSLNYYFLLSKKLKQTFSCPQLPIYRIDPLFNPSHMRNHMFVIAEIKPNISAKIPNKLTPALNSPPEIIGIFNFGDLWGFYPFSLL
jgi:hypothetical protein